MRRRSVSALSTAARRLTAPMHLSGMGGVGVRAERNALAIATLNLRHANGDPRCDKEESEETDRRRGQGTSALGDFEDVELRRIAGQRIDVERQQQHCQRHTTPQSSGRSRSPPRAERDDRRSPSTVVATCPPESPPPPAGGAATPDRRSARRRAPRRDHARGVRPRAMNVNRRERKGDEERDQQPDAGGKHGDDQVNVRAATGKAVTL